MTEQTLQELKTKIQQIPILRWWKHPDEMVFVVEGQKLVNQGFTVDEAIQILSALYSAVRNEFRN